MGGSGGKRQRERARREAEGQRQVQAIQNPPERQDIAPPIARRDLGAEARALPERAERSRRLREDLDGIETK